MTAPSIDGYTFLDPLGEGSQGRVFRGRREVDGRAVAVKLLDADLEYEPPYLVFSLIEGADLSRRLRGGPLKEPETRALLARVAGAVGQLHQAGVTHRDVKPANIFLGDSGEAYLGGPGLAISPESDVLTKTGFVVGTLSYLAPEVLDGNRAGPPADVFALGVALVEAITGQRPLVSTAGVILGPGGAAPECSRAFESLVLWMLLRDSRSGRRRRSPRTERFVGRPRPRRRRASPGRSWNHQRRVVPASPVSPLPKSRPA